MKKQNKQQPKAAVTELSVRIRYEMLEPEKLSGAKFNPPSRTTSGAMLALENDIKDNGILKAIHAIPTPDNLHPYLIVDGHRRHRVALKYGQGKVMVAIHEDVSLSDAPALWARLNRNTRNVSSYEWLVMWLTSGAKCDESLPRVVMYQIRSCVKIMGGNPLSTQRLVDAKISPSICERIEFIHRAFSDKERSVIDVRDGRSVNSIPTKSKIMDWCLKHQGSQGVLDALKSIGRNGLPTPMLRKLFRKINSDSPVTLTDLMPKIRK